MSTLEFTEEHYIIPSVSRALRESRALTTSPHWNETWCLLWLQPCLGICSAQPADTNTAIAHRSHPCKNLSHLLSYKVSWIHHMTCVKSKRHASMKIQSRAGFVFFLLVWILYCYLFIFLKGRAKMKANSGTPAAFKTDHLKINMLCKCTLTALLHWRCFCC